MKNDYFEHYKRFKMFQLVMMIIFTVAFFSFIHIDPLIRYNVYSNRILLTICVFLWAFMIYSTITLVWDFRQLERNIIDNHALNQVAYLDNLTGIPNRNSCDIVLDKYRHSTDISELGMALISISNIETINKTLGRRTGDMFIQSFSLILEKTGKKYGFVGRNGGNEYIAVIENCDRVKMDSFLKEVADAFNAENPDNGEMSISLSCNYIINVEEHLTSFADMIATLYQSREHGNV